MLSSIQEEKLDPRIKRTRGLILQTVETLLAEKSFNAITVQDITDMAEINRATFYAHFHDKFALLDYKIRQDFRAELEQRTLNACHFSVDNLRALIVTVCEFIGEANTQCKSPRSQFGPLMETQIKEQTKGLLMTWLEQIGSNPSPEIAATAASWAIYGLAQYWNEQKDHDSLGEYIEKIMPLAEVNLQFSRA